MKKLLFILSIIVVGFTACTKEGDIGPQGEKGEKGEKGEAGPGIETYEFSLTFGTSVTEQSYQMPDNSMYDKVTLVYLELGYKNYVLLPYSDINTGYTTVHFSAISDPILEKIKIKTEKDDGSSPWIVNNVEKNFRAVVMEKSGMISNPNVDYSNYKEVAEHFNVK